MTTVHKDVVAKPALNEAGQVSALETSIGSDSYSFRFEASGSPLHFFGPQTDSSLGTTPVRSWCWVEYAGGMLTPELLDMSLAPFRLARGGRPAIH